MRFYTSLLVSSLMGLVTLSWVVGIHPVDRLAFAAEDPALNSPNFFHRGSGR